MSIHDNISQDVKNDIKSGALQISAVSFALYWHMILLYGHNEWFTMELKEMAEKVGTNIHTAQKYRNELEAVGLIETKKVSHKRLEYRVIR